MSRLDRSPQPDGYDFALFRLSALGRLLTAAGVLAALLPAIRASGAELGEIAGRVLDARGDVVTGAMVLVCDEQTGIPVERDTCRPFTQSLITYEQALCDLHSVLGEQYPGFGLKGIDWRAVGEELLAKASDVKDDVAFGLLCLELVARLEDSHAQLLPGAASIPAVPFPQWDPGLACLVDDRGEPVVYYVDHSGPAERAGVEVGMTVAAVNGEPAQAAIERTMKMLSRYVGYSSQRYLRYHACHWFLRQETRAANTILTMKDTQGRSIQFSLPATCGARYLPRLPVPIPGINDSGSVSWKMLDNHIGYIYVRRIQNDLIPLLDKAVSQLQAARGLVIDVRGNSGGGFDSRRAHLNFALDRDGEEPDRPRFKGPIAVLVDARCISAGEGWASWFVANRRAHLFGEGTAGASARKTTYTLKNGLFQVRFSVKLYRGYLDRPIERLGLTPDTPLMPNAKDLAEGRDTVLEAAREYLLDEP